MNGVSLLGIIMSYQKDANLLTTEHNHDHNNYNIASHCDIMKSASGLRIPDNPDTESTSDARHRGRE